MENIMPSYMLPTTASAKKTRRGGEQQKGSRSGWLSQKGEGADDLGCVLSTFDAPHSQGSGKTPLGTSARFKQAPPDCRQDLAQPVFGEKAIGGATSMQKRVSRKSRLSVAGGYRIPSAGDGVDFCPPTSTFAPSSSKGGAVYGPRRNTTLRAERADWTKLNVDSELEYCAGAQDSFMPSSTFDTKKSVVTMKKDSKHGRFSDVHCIYKKALEK